MDAEMIRTLKAYVKTLDKLDVLKLEKKEYIKTKKECHSFLQNVCEENDTCLKTSDITYEVQDKRKYREAFKPLYVHTKIMDKLPGADIDKQRILDFILDVDDEDNVEVDILKIKKL